MQTFFDVRASHFPWKCYSLAKKRNIFIGFSTHFHIHGSTLTTRGASARERPNSCTQSSQFARSSASYANLKFPLFFSVLLTLCAFFLQQKFPTQRSRRGVQVGRGRERKSKHNKMCALLSLVYLPTLNYFRRFGFFSLTHPRLRLNIPSCRGTARVSPRVVS